MTEWKAYKLVDIAEIVTDRVSIENVTLDIYISTDNMINDFGGVVIAEKIPSATSVNCFSTNDVYSGHIDPL